MTARTAIVTGATSGVGRQVAVQLARSGYQVVLAARRATELNQTVQLVHEANPDAACLAQAADVCEPAACHRVVQSAEAKFGSIDALANVAGYALLSSIDQITDNVWRTIVDTNLTAAIHLTAAVWPLFKRQRSGCLVNVSSMASIDPFAGFAMYAAAKAGLNMFTRCAAQEGEAFGVKVVCLAPGAIETPMLRSLFDEKTIRPARTLDPADVAAKICQYITGQQTFVSGATIPMPSP